MIYHTDTITIKVKTNWDKVHFRYKWYVVSTFVLILLFLFYLLVAFQIKDRTLRFLNVMTITALTSIGAVSALVFPIIHYKVNFYGSGYLSWVFSVDKDDFSHFKKERQKSIVIWIHTIWTTFLLSSLGVASLVFAILTANESLFRSLIFVTNCVMAWAIAGSNFVWGKWIIKESYFE